MLVRGDSDVCRAELGYGREREDIGFGNPSYKTVSMSQDDSSVRIDHVSSRLSRRATLFMLGSLAFALASLVLALEFFVVERIPLLTEAELNAAKKRWQEHGPVSYDMDIELRGAQPG